VSEAVNTIDAGPKPHGTLYKGVELAMGAASLASIPLSFSPFWLMATALQAGITVVQTGMDLATSGPKKAALSFATGTLLTAFTAIPGLGAIGSAARAVGVGGRVAETVVAGGAALGEAGKTVEAATAVKDGAGVFNTVRGAFNTATTGVKTAAANVGGKISEVPGIGSHLVPAARATAAGVGRATNYVKETAGAAKTFAGEQAMRVPPVKYAVNGLTKTEAALTAGLRKNNAIATAGKWVDGHKGISHALQIGTMVGGVGLSAIGNTPPGNLVHPSTYDFSNPDARTDNAARVLKRRQEEAALQTSSPLPG
jgi:hypothetical protein